jgi:dephospho-CoA kinase
MSAAKPLIIAITGFTGSGKTVAARSLAERGYYIIDVDEFVHDLYRNGRPLWKKIVSTYGNAVLQSDGEIWRQKLAETIFSDLKTYEKFTKIIYPAMNSALLKLIRSKKGTVIVDMAVLFESGFNRYADSIIFVKTSENIWKKRIKKFKWKNYTGIRKFQTLFPMTKKIALSNYILYNNQSKNDLCLKITKLIKKIEEGINGRQASTAGRKDK